MNITHLLAAGALALAARGSAATLTSASPAAHANESTTSQTEETAVTQGVRQLEDMHVARITVLDATTGKPTAVVDDDVPRYLGQ